MADIPESAIWAVAQALHRDYCDSHRVEWEHCLPKARAVLAAASPHLVAAAEARGRKQALLDAAVAMDAIDEHGEGWTDCLNDQPHARATGNCITPPDWLRARAYAAGQDTATPGPTSTTAGHQTVGPPSGTQRIHVNLTGPAEQDSG